MPRSEVTGLEGLSRDSVSHLLKYDYLDEVWDDALQAEHNLVGWIEKRAGIKETIGGKFALSHLMTGRIESAGMGRKEGDDLPLAGRHTGVQPEMAPKALYGAVRTTGHAKRSWKKGKKVAFLNGLAKALEQFRETWVLNTNRMLHHGPLDILGRATTYAAGTPLVTMTNRNGVTSDIDDRFRSGCKYLREGMAVTVVPSVAAVVQPLGSTGSGAFADGQANIRYVGAIDDSAETWRPEDANGNASAFATDWTANDDGALIVPWRSRTDAPGADDANFNFDEMQHINGLASMIADATLKDFMYGLSRTSNPALESYVNRNGGTVRAYDESIITFGIERCEEGRHRNKREIDMLLYARSLRREHVEDVQAQREFAPVTTKRGWGKQSFTANGKMLPIEVDRDAALGTIQGLDMSSFAKYKEDDIQPVDQDYDERFIANKDASVRYIVESCNVGCTAAPANMLITDMQYSETALVP